MSKLFLPASELLEAGTTINYLITKIIERDTTGELFGPSGGGKTFLALDMALAIATAGETLNGQQSGQGIVLYLAGEGRGGLARRVKAWLTYHGKSVDDLGLFHVSRQTVSFDGNGLDGIRTEAQKLSEIHGVPVALIVIDTLARHIEGDENKTSDMGDFIRKVDSLRVEFPGSVALIVHHTGHGEDSKNRSRGSSALRAAMDFEIKCNSGLITFTKMKDGEPPSDIEFNLLPVNIGVDQDGQPLTSCVVSYGERSERHKAAGYSPVEKQAITALVNASSGSLRVEDVGKWGALVGDWRQAFYDLRKKQDPDLKTDTMKKSFIRIHSSLLEKGFVQESGHVRLLASEDHQAQVRTAIFAENLLQKNGHGT